MKAIVVATASVALIKRLGLKTLSGRSDHNSAQEPGTWRSLCGRRHNFWLGLGAHGCLPGTAFCSRGKWRYGDGRCHCQRARWNFPVRIAKSEASPLGCPGSVPRLSSAYSLRSSVRVQLPPVLPS
jgi:hypothetical protein